jgi:hypothetical protein
MPAVTPASVNQTINVDDNTAPVIHRYTCSDNYRRLHTADAPAPLTTVAALELLVLLSLMLVLLMLH